MGCVRPVDEDPISGDARVLQRAFGLARVRVDAEMGKVAARNVEAQPVPEVKRLLVEKSSIVIA
jgi:hypothetical protein